MSFGKVGQLYRFYFSLKNGNGSARTGAAASVTATIRNPANTVSNTPTVTEVAGGLYFIDILASFTTTNGVGEYGILLEITTPPRDTFAQSIPFFSVNLDDLSIPGSAMQLVSGVPQLISDTVWDEGLTSHLGLGSTGRALNDSVSGIPVIDNALIADAVWDEGLAAHLSSGSTGEALSDASKTSGVPTALGIANSVWATQLPGAFIVNSSGEKLDSIDVTVGTNLNATISSRAIPGDAMLLTGAAVDAVWDDPISAHLGLGSTGRALNDSNSGTTVATIDIPAIVDAVWDEPVIAHTTPSTFGGEVTADDVWTEDLPQTFPVDSAGERLATIDDTIASIISNQPDQPFTITDLTLDVTSTPIGKIVVAGVIPEGVVVAFADTDVDLTTPLFAAFILNDGSFKLVVDKKGTPIYRVTAVADRFTEFTVVRVQI